MDPSLNVYSMYMEGRLSIHTRVSFAEQFVLVKLACVVDPWFLRQRFPAFLELGDVTNGGQGFRVLINAGSHVLPLSIRLHLP